MASQPPGFLLKLNLLLGEPKNQEYVSWSINGKSFVIKDPDNFSKFVLPLYYKHNKLSSFVRQLNLYGFQKVLTFSQENSSLHIQRDSMEFQHPFFIKNNTELLSSIKRKNASVKRKNIVYETNDDFINKLKELETVYSRKNSSLSMLQQENNYLWREVVSLRQKNSRQQNVVNHLVKFLLSLVKHPRKGGKRTFALMVGKTDENLQPCSKVANQNTHIQSISHNPYFTSHGPSRKKVAVISDADVNLTADISSCFESIDKCSFSNVDCSDTNTIEQDSSKVICSTALDTPLDGLNNDQVSHLESFSKSDLSAKTSKHSNRSVDAFNFETPFNDRSSSTTSSDSFISDNHCLFGDIASEFTACENDSDLIAVNPSSCSKKTKEHNLSSKPLPTNSNEVQSKLQGLQERLLNNEQIELDYDVMQELFNNSVDLLPQPSYLDDSFFSTKHQSNEGAEVMHYKSNTSNESFDQIDLDEILELLK